uniref:NAD(P)-dependent oxidoreductase n=1 Tax=Candidatus Enterococcus willemsii TaxID=1857215 RepID=UPI00403F606C
MNIGIIGATGNLGKILTEKFINEGIEPTAIIRNKNKMHITIPTIVKDLYELTTEDIKNFDIVINAFNAPVDEPEQFVTSMKHLISIFKHTDTCLMIAGGAGILAVSEDTLLVETPDVPEEFKPIAEAEVDAYRLLENEQSFDWMYMAPAALMTTNLPYKGVHHFSGDKLGVNEEGQSEISYEDYAEAFVEKALHPQNHQIIGVYS